MDKYEYKLKLDEIESLANDKNYAAAAEIADTINWRKVRSVSTLVMVGEVYQQTKRYEDSKELFLLAYDRSPIGKKIIYRLAEIAIEAGQFDEAKEYYDEFVEIAPHDTYRYVLQYHMSKAKGEPYEKQIEILTELKEQEYTEEWAYELVYLYYQAGMREKCIEACDELILWFGDGPYVEKALELKMFYQPLSPEQEEKYRQFRRQRDGIIEVRPDDYLESGEIIHNPISIPEVHVNADRFNTQNLQEELAKGMQQIMEATRKETVNDTMDSIKKLVEEIPYLQPLLADDQDNYDNPNLPHIETDEEIDGSLSVNFQEILGEEYDGQMSMSLPSGGLHETQITGQMTIEDVLAEWEKTKRAAEIVMEDAAQRKLESAKARALQEAGDIMDRLTAVIPQLDAGATTKELVEQAYETQTPESIDAATAAMATVNERIQEEIDRLQQEQPEVDFGEIGVSMPEQPEEQLQEEVEQAIADATTEEMPIEEVPENLPEETDAEESFEKLISEWENMKDPTTPLPEISMDLFEEDMPEAPDVRQDELYTTPEPVDEPVEKPPVHTGEFIPILKLDSESTKQLSYFATVDGMERQVCRIINNCGEYLIGKRETPPANLIIEGASGCGKTMLATNIVKLLQQKTGKPGKSIGKINGDTLNHKNVSSLMDKISGGCLIIEHAGELTRETQIEVAEYLANDTSGMLVILEDNTEGITKALGRCESFRNQFSERITIPYFTNDELVEFAKTYANENGYGIDPMAMLALHTRINNIQKLDQATTLVEVKEIVDEAIDHVEKGGLKKVFGIITSKRYDENNYVILHEKDFGE